MSKKKMIQVLPRSNSENDSQRHLIAHLTLTTILAGMAMLPISAEAADSNPQQLPTVTVEGSRDSDGYTTTESSLYKITTPLLDTPQTITSIPRKLLDDQNATTMRDALRNVPGISIAAGEGGSQGDNLTIRGFTARSDFFLDGMRDFGSYYRDPFDLESIDVLKGPDSILFGRGSTGGVVNQVSKSAELYNFNSSTMTLGTDNTRRATVDVNERTGQTTAVRLNVMDNSGDVAERNGAHNDRYGFAPSLAFGLGTDTRVTFDWLHQNENDIPDYGVPWFFGKPADVPRDNFYGFQQGDNDYIKTNVDVGTLKFEHDINSNMTIRDQLRFANYARNVRITEPGLPAGVLITTPLDTITMVRKELESDSTERMTGNQTDLTSKFDTGSFKHTLVSGIELSTEASNPIRHTYTGVPGTNLVDPNEDQDFTGTSALSSNVRASADTVAAYFTDTMAINPQWDVIGGLRYDHIDSEYEQFVGAASSFSRTDELVSWRGGVVYKPQPNGSIYVNVGTSFNPSVEQLSLSAANADTAPEKSMTYEVGTKWELLKKKLTTTLAIFRDDKTNARTPDPNNALLNVLSGEQRVDGFELSATGHITDKWEVFGGYTFLHSEVIKSTNPLEQGNPVANAPMHTISIWTTYELPYKLTIGGGAKAVSQRNSSTTPNATSGRMQTAPGYMTLDAMAKYPLTEKVSLQLNVTNLTNRLYYDQLHPAHVIPGPGRTALLSTTFSF